MSRSIALIPPSVEFLDNRIFDAAGPLNRDAALTPWIRLREALARRDIALETVDVCRDAPLAWLHANASTPPPVEADPTRTVIQVFEPKILAPYWYRRSGREQLPYASVQIMSLELAERGPPLELLRYPQVLPESVPEVVRDLTLVMINNRHYPPITRHSLPIRSGELYSARERVAAPLARTGDIDVFGRGWGSFLPRHPLSSIRNLSLRPAVRGSVPTKVEVLARSRFCLCFENWRHPGFHTEKLFDAMASGAIPIYLGDPSITDVVPPDAFIDFREVKSVRALRRLVRHMPDRRQNEYRVAGQRFLQSSAFAAYRVEAFVDRVDKALGAAMSSASGDPFVIDHGRDGEYAAPDPGSQ